MKRGKAYARADQLLAADKAAMGEESRKLFLLDFSRMAAEYFDLVSAPEMEIAGKEGKYEVKLTFSAGRVKNLYALK